MNLRFPGHYFDQETNLHYNRFRYYSPELGRYLQSDPIGLAGGPNLYAYTINPLKWVDLRGTCPDEPEDENANSNNSTTQQAGPEKEETPAEGAGAKASAAVPLETAEAVVAKALNDAGVGIGKVKLFQVATMEDGTVRVGISGDEKSAQSAINRTTLPDGYTMGPAKADVPAATTQPMNSDGTPYKGDSTSCAEPRLQSAIGSDPVAQKGAPVWRGDPADNPYPLTKSDGTQDTSRMDPCPSCKSRGLQ